MTDTTITITNIPQTPPGELMETLVDQVLTCVDAPLEREPVLRAVKAWILITAIVDQHEKLSGSRTLEIETLLGLIACSIMEPPSEVRAARDPKLPPRPDSSATSRPPSETT